MLLITIFGTKREEITDWRNMHTDGVHDFYFSPNIVTVIEAVKSMLNGSRRNQMTQCEPDLCGSG